MIEDPLEDLGERLLNCDPIDRQLSQKYRKEISALLHRELNPIGRWLQFLVGIVFTLVGSLGLVITPHSTTPPDPSLRRAGMVACSFMAVWGVALLICAIRRLNPNRYQFLWFNLGTLFMVGLAAVLLTGSWQTTDRTLDLQLAHLAFVLLGILALSTTVHFIQYYHKRTHLKLLELEYHLANLASKLELK